MNASIANIDTAAFMPAVDYAHATLDIDELLPPCGEYPVDYGKKDPDPIDTARPEKISPMTLAPPGAFRQGRRPERPELLRHTRQLRRQTHETHR